MTEKRPVAWWETVLWGLAAVLAAIGAVALVGIVTAGCAYAPVQNPKIYVEKVVLPSGGTCRDAEVVLSRDPEKADKEEAGDE